MQQDHRQEHQQVARSKVACHDHHPERPGRGLPCRTRVDAGGESATRKNLRTEGQSRSAESCHADDRGKRPASIDGPKVVLRRGARNMSVWNRGWLSGCERKSRPAGVGSARERPPGSDEFVHVATRAYKVVTRLGGLFLSSAETVQRLRFVVVDSQHLGQTCEDEHFTDAVCRT